MQLSRCPRRLAAPWEPDAADGGRGRAPSLDSALMGPSLYLVSLQAGSRKARPVGHSTCLPRKEVIQPHLPVRLPCYDFTPLTLHTFDASVPRGFGRRLRVQTTRVV